MRTDLTVRQRQRLRAAARALRPIASVGKVGLSSAAVEHLRRLLDRRELVKVRLLDSVAGERERLARQVAVACDAALVDLVGRVVVLYRPSEDLSEDRRVRLDR